MEDAAVQAGSFGAKSRSSQTPPPSTPRPTRSPTDGICDLLRTQSLPADSQEWLGALVSSNTAVTEFGNAAADHALKVSRSRALVQSKTCLNADISIETQKGSARVTL